MRVMKRLLGAGFWVILILVLSAGNRAFAENTLQVEVLPKVVKQGGVCFIRSSGSASLKSVEGEFRGDKIPMAPELRSKTYDGLLGVDMDVPPGRYPIRIRAIGDSERICEGSGLLEVKKVDFKTQKLRLPAAMVDLDPKNLARVNQETKRLDELFAEARGERLWKGAFLRPVPGEISTTFGLRRIVNRQTKNPHSGVDLRAGEGAPVLASNSGIAILVDELFFSGKSVVIDHGWGMYSMYFHLSEFLVREGDSVEKGVILGRVGSTGRSTGPHLHWGIKIRGARVDPFSLVKLTERLQD
jgi:murein DD-endopeptidase MepM/ murein hydrolase activator NlpD